jgi:beta-barrel assembly-enhancing protease
MPRIGGPGKRFRHAAAVGLGLLAAPGSGGLDWKLRRRPGKAGARIAPAFEVTMRHGPVFRGVAVLTLAAFTLFCAPTRIPPISSAGAAFQPDRDEQRLWADARAEEKKLRENAPIYNDPLLVDYLESIVHDLNPPGMAANPAIRYRVSVIEDPTLNAFAYPHGSLYVHTGLLARMENEHQLATVLGHEMTHVENRHLLRYQRSARNKQIGLMAAAVAGAIILAGEEADAWREGKYGKAVRTRVLGDLILGLGLQLAFIAAVNGYGRDLEREADEGGFVKMAAAGYDTREAPKVYQALLDDHGQPSKAEAFFFGSHPRLTERIESARAWNMSNEAPPPAARRDPTEFERRIRPVVRDDARLNLEMGRLNLAEDQLNRAMEMMPDDPEARYLLGRLKLARLDGAPDEAAKAQLREEAMAAFRESIRLDANRPGPHREMGLLAYRTGDFETACVAFGHYLELDPKAEDAQTIRDYRLELQRAGHCR